MVNSRLMKMRCNNAYCSINALSNVDLFYMPVAPNNEVYGHPLISSPGQLK